MEDEFQTNTDQTNETTNQKISTPNKTIPTVESKNTEKKKSHSKRIKTCVAFLLIGIVAIVGGIFTAKYLNSDEWKNRDKAQETNSSYLPAQPNVSETPAALSDPAVRAEVVASLDQCLQKWMAAWKAGDASAFWEPVFFSESKGNSDQTLPGNMIPIDDDDFNQELADAFGNLMDPQKNGQEEPETAQTLTQSILPYLEISYALPSDPDSPFQVEFQITSPDMLQILENFPDEDDPARLLAGIQQSLKGGAYLKKTGTVTVGIIQTENAWRLADSYEFADAIYGGLLTMYRNSMGEAYHALFSQIELEMENKELGMEEEENE